MTQQSMFDTEDKKKAAEDLIRIADQMEMCDNPWIKKELKRDYAIALKRVGITNKKGNVKGNNGFSKEKLLNSKSEALEKIKTILDNAPASIEEINSNTSGKNVFIISMIVNHKGMPMEVNLEHCDSFYGSYSGYACIKARKSLFSEEQLKGYPTVEYGLISFGMDLIRDKEEKAAFFNKYAAPYNERIKSTK